MSEQENPFDRWWREAGVEEVSGGSYARQSVGWQRDRRFDGEGVFQVNPGSFQLTGDLIDSVADGMFTSRPHQLSDAKVAELLGVDLSPAEPRYGTDREAAEEHELLRKLYSNQVLTSENMPEGSFLINSEPIELSADMLKGNPIVLTDSARFQFIRSGLTRFDQAGRAVPDPDTSDQAQVKAEREARQAPAPEAPRGPRGPIRVRPQGQLPRGSE